MQFYLAFPFLALLLRRFGYAAGSALLIGVWWFCNSQIAVGATATPGPWGLFPMASFLPLRLLMFLIGMVAARGLIRLHHGARAWPFLLVSAVMALAYQKEFAAAVVPLLIYETLLHWPGLSGRFRPWLEYAERWLASRAVVFLADCSYGVYLLHMLVLIPLIYGLSRMSGFAALAPLPRFAIALALAVVPVYAITWGLCRLIERPGIKLGKTLLKRWDSTAPR